MRALNSFFVYFFFYQDSKTWGSPQNFIIKKSSNHSSLSEGFKKRGERREKEAIQTKRREKKKKEGFTKLSPNENNYADVIGATGQSSCFFFFFFCFVPKHSENDNVGEVVVWLDSAWRRTPRTKERMSFFGSFERSSCLCSFFFGWFVSFLMFVRFCFLLLLCFVLFFVVVVEINNCEKISS